MFAPFATSKVTTGRWPNSAARFSAVLPPLNDITEARAGQLNLVTSKVNQKMTQQNYGESIINKTIRSD
jgi:hypothetical protein